MNKYCVVLTTFADETIATKIINAVLEKKLVACAQEIKIRSHYIWQDAVQHDPEILVLFKTTWQSYGELESLIKKLHPYEIPEIIAVDIEKGLQNYLGWIDTVTKKI